MVRHAEVHNPRDILYGRLPRFRLSERGRLQAEQTARFLAARPLDAIYSSPLLRARETADILSHYHPAASVRLSRALIEVRTGYEGSSNSVLKAGFSFYEPRKDPHDETMQDVFDRMMRLLQRAARRHAGRAFAIVSHGDPIAIVRIGLLGQALSAANLHATAYPTRSSVNQVRLEPGGPPQLAYFNVAETAA